MSARDLSKIGLRDGYSDSNSNLIRDFLSPCLNNSVRYDRSVGYFSSALWNLISAEIVGFFQNGGRMRLICSPHLSSQDAEALQSIDRFSMEDVGSYLSDQLQRWDRENGNRATSSLLRNLISAGVLEVRIAVLRKNTRGMLHSKEGLFSDGLNTVAFIGSANETASGWSDLGNHESIEVFRSWEEDDRRRVGKFEDGFAAMWDGTNHKIRLLRSEDLPEVFVAREDDLSLDECRALLRNIMAGERQRLRLGKSEHRAPRELQEHQKQAVTNWELAGNRGLITFVTGGGKTLTALAIIRKWLELGRPIIVLVPSRLLISQWRIEIENELADLDVQVFQVGAGVPSSVWKQRLRLALSTSGRNERTVVLSTYQSAATEAFLDRVPNAGDLLLVCDEVHRVGAPDTRKIMTTIDAGARLGLSATPWRFGDEVGSTMIRNYFEPVLEPKFSIADAIREHRLVPYTYEIETVTLTKSEEEAWDDLTAKIGRIVATNHGQIPKNHAGFDALVRARAQIVKEASQKDALVAAKCMEILEPADHLLIYCNTRDQVTRIVSRIRQGFADQDRRQRVLEYHSGLGDDQRQATIEYFTRNGGVLVAIKCLDEGVDIPVLNKAIIAASSQNPREYIQRRGRVLRAIPGSNKFTSAIVDTVVLRNDQTVVQPSELIRALEFAETSASPSATIKIRQLCQRSKIDPNSFSDYDSFEEEGAEGEAE